MVKDPTGALVARARITVVNNSTAMRQTMQTDEQGWYEFLLPAGTYRLAVEATGFRPYVSDGLVLGPTASLRSDGDAPDGEPGGKRAGERHRNPRWDTASTQVGEGISQEKMTSVPLNGRSFTDLLALQAGVVHASSAQPNAVVMSGCTSTPPSGDLNPGNMSVSGQRETANGLCGQWAARWRRTSTTRPVSFPTWIRLRSFRVLTSNFDAEYGNFSGGQVLVTTKTGRQPDARQRL